VAAVKGRVAADLPSLPSVRLHYLPIPAGWRSVFQLHDIIKARVCRLAELTQGLAKEENAWKARQGPLLPQERKRYLDALLAGLDEARNVLAGW
jgi:hypothetical protein